MTASKPEFQITDERLAELIAICQTCNDGYLSDCASAFRELQRRRAQVAMPIREDQLNIIRDVFNECDEEVLLYRTRIEFDDVTRTVTIRIEDINDQDYRELAAAPQGGT